MHVLALLLATETVSRAAYHAAVEFLNRKLKH